MYVDDIIVYVLVLIYDLVVFKLNEVLVRLYIWCCENCFILYFIKMEYILFGGCGKFIGLK